MLYVLDTSVILSDPKCLERLSDKRVVIPLVVLVELEAKRNHPDLGYAARSALRTLEGYRKYYDSLTEDIPTGSGGTVRVEINHIDESNLPPSLKVPENDNRILAVAANLKKEGEVTLLTKDLPLRLKASVAGVPANDYNFETIDIDWPGVIELDVTQKDVNDLYEFEQSYIAKAARHPINTGLILKSHDSSALGRVTKNGEVKLVKSKRLFDLGGKSAEQRLALDLLSDSSVGIVSLAGKAGTGKAQTLNSKVPVPICKKFPNGWAFFSELEIGDLVYGSDGNSVPIVALSEIFNDQDCFRITFSDGQSVECNGEHLWEVSSMASRNMRSPGLVKLREQREGIMLDRARQAKDLCDDFKEGEMASCRDLSELLDRSRSYITTIARNNNVKEELRNRSIYFEAIPSLLAIAKNCERLAYCSDSGQSVVPLTEVVSTYSLLEKMVNGTKEGNNWAVSVKHIEGLQEDLLVDPYVLGLWLGDGANLKNTIKSGDADKDGSRDADNIMPHILETGIDAYYCEKYQEFRLLDFVTKLKEIEVYGNKHIPSIYKRSSIEQRLNLLQGLMDTDGTIDEGGQCELSLSDEKLASDSLELIRSLGIKASKTIGQAGYKKDGNYIKCKDRVRIHFTPTDFVFKLPRKVNRLKTTVRSTQYWNYITKIEKIPTVKTRCIQVGSEDGIYLTEQFIPTHNSSIALAAGLDAVLEQRRYNKVTVFRPLYAVGGQDLGFLPGTAEEKMGPWAQAIFDCLESFCGDNVIDTIIEDNLLEVLPLTHIRGRTLTNSYVIIEEAQNLDSMVLLTALSRIGKNSKVVLTHDVAQRDNLRVGKYDGVSRVVNKLLGHSLFAHITLQKSERSAIAELVSNLLEEG